MRSLRKHGGLRVPRDEARSLRYSSERLSTTVDFRSIAGRLSSRVFATLIQAVTILLLAREFGPKSFGFYAQAVSIATLLIAFLGFGSGAMALRGGALLPPGWQVALLRLGFGCYVSAAALAVVGFMVTGDLNIWIVCGAVFATTEAVNELLVAIRAGEGRQRQASLLPIIRRGVILTVVGAALLLGSDMALPLIVACVATLSPAVLLMCAARGEATPRDILGVAPSYWANSMATQTLNFDTTVVRLSIGIASVGTYAAGVRFASPLNLVSNSLSSIFVPALSAAPVGEQRSSERRVVAAGFIGLCAIGLLTPIVVFVAHRFLGGQFPGIGYIVAAAGVGGALSCLSQSLQSILLARNRAGAAAAAILLGTLLGLASLAIFGLSLGSITGVAIGLVVMQAGILGFLALLVWGSPDAKP